MKHVTPERKGKEKEGGEHETRQIKHIQSHNEKKEGRLDPQRGGEELEPKGAGEDEEPGMERKGDEEGGEEDDEG